MTLTLIDRITTVVQGAPAWVRSDLSSRDQAIRARAEETMAAMIASALADVGESGSTPDA